MSTRVYAQIRLVLFGALLGWSLESLAVGQTTSPKEAQAIAMIEKACGVVLKDAGGRITSISLIADIDVDIESIDFSVFLHVESLSVHNVKTKTKKLSLAPFLKLPPGLQTLRILGADISDQQFGQLLQKQKSISMLFLSHTTISDRSLEKIGKLQKLNSLYMDGTKITNKGLKGLLDLEKLFSLDLRNTEISDAGLAEIQNIGNLGVLHLSGTKVTDAGILQLANIKWLHRIDVSNTKVTEAGKKALQQLRPQLEISK
jgi:internalin A